MKKRLFTAFLAFALVMGLGACGSAAGDKDPENGQKPGVEQEEDQGDEENGDTVTNGGVQAPTDGGVEAPTDGGVQGSGGSGETNSGQTAGKPNTSKPPVSKPNTGETTSKPSISGSFDEIIQNIYDKVGYGVKTANTEVTADNAAYYLGVGDIKFKKALASEPMMSSVAHSVVLLEVEDGADISAIKKEIKENVDGRKWVCVGVEAEDILVENVGNYIMLVMDEDAQSFMDAFQAMGK